MKAIVAKYSANANALAYAAAQFAEHGDEGKAIAATDAKLAADDAAAKDATIAAQAAKIAELEAQVAALMPKEAEVEDLSKAKLATETALAAETAKVAELSAKLTETEAKFNEASSKLRRYGVKPVNLGKPEPTSHPALVCTKAEFDSKSPAEKSEFSRKGGRISE